MFVVVVVDTPLPRFEALAYVLPHFDELTHVLRSSFKGLLRSNSVFVKRSFSESSQGVHRSVIAESSKAFIFQKFVVKFFFGLSRH